MPLDWKGVEPVSGSAGAELESLNGRGGTVRRGRGWVGMKKVGSKVRPPDGEKKEPFRRQNPRERA